MSGCGKYCVLMYQRVSSNPDIKMVSLAEKILQVEHQSHWKGNNRVTMIKFSPFYMHDGRVYNMEITILHKFMKQTPVCALFKSKAIWFSL